jgi:hypothetical protein
MKRIILLFVLFLSISFAAINSGCTKRTDNQTPENLASATPTISTVFPFTATGTPVETTIISPPGNCWEQLPSSSIPKSIVGSILYYSLERNNPLAYDIGNTHTKDVSVDLNSYTFISPDGQTILSYNPLSEKVKIISESRNLEYSTPDNLYFNGYVSIGAFFGISRALERNYQAGIGSTDQYYILSLDTGDYSLFSQSLPFLELNPNSYAEYSPDLNYVVYPAFYQGSLTMILLDTKSQEIKWNGWDEGFPIGNFPKYPKPAWAPDGNSFSIVMEDEGGGTENLYNVTLNGDIQQISYIEKILGFAYSIRSLIWSPNGDYLAVRVANSEDQSQDFLLIIDIENRTILNPCLLLGNDTSQPIGQPVWSPTGDVLAVVPEDSTGIVIVDMKNEKIYRLVDEQGIRSADLLGWLDWTIP